jgi:hypothetical protein
MTPSVGAVHAVLAPLAKMTICGEKPPRGLVVDRDDKVARFLTSIARCERCRSGLHAHRARVKAAHESNERKLAAARAAQQAAAAPPISTGRDARRAEQAKAARERSAALYAARTRALVYQPPKRSP